MNRMRRKAFSLFAFQDIITSVTGVIVLVMLLLALELTRHSRMSSLPAIPIEVDSLSNALESLEKEIQLAQNSLRANKAEIDELANLPASDLQRRRQKLRVAISSLQGKIADSEAAVEVVQLETEVLASTNAKPEGEETDLEKLRNAIAELEEQLLKLKQSDRTIFNPNSNTEKRSWLVDISPHVILVAEVGRSAQPIQFREESPKQRIRELLNWARTRSKSREYFVLLIRPKAIGLYHEIRSSLEELGYDLGFDLLGDEETVIDPSTGTVYSE